MIKFQALFKFLKPLVVTSVIAGGILTVMAPYGTQALSALPRALYWVGFCMAGGMGAAAFDRFSQNNRHGKTLMRRAFWQSLGATLSVSVCLIGLLLYLNGDIPLSYYGQIPFKIWIISILICGAALSLRRDEVSNPEAKRPAIFDRIKPALRKAKIYALSAEDHYVRVHTSKGDDLILMRLTDAIDEVVPISGLSPHRSWWVAEDAVNDIIRADGKHKISLKNDLMAPVSRGRVKILHEAGWL